jgi:hypothetical protein
LFFAGAVRRIPLTYLGLLQYLTPSVQFVLGVFVFGEPMPPERLAGDQLTFGAPESPSPASPSPAGLSELEFDVGAGGGAGVPQPQHAGVGVVAQVGEVGAAGQDGGGLGRDA